MSKHPGVNRTPKENAQSGKPKGTKKIISIHK